MRTPDPFAGIAAEEEFVSAACAAVAAWVPNAEAELHVLAAAHLQTATALHARSRRWSKLHASLRAMLSAAVGTELGALTWLRRHEQRLVDRYVGLEASAALDEAARRRLRRTLVPDAFDRFSRVDRLIMRREERGAYA